MADDGQGDGGEKEGERGGEERRREGAHNQGRERRAQSAEDILIRDLVQNARSSGEKLKELLNTSILVNLIDSGKRYVIDWTQPEIRAEAGTRDSAAECTILLSEDNLKRIAQGDLNPQIAMLSDKVRIEGRKAVAMYFFNLIAPRAGI